MCASKGFFLVPCGKQILGGKKRSRAGWRLLQDGSGLALSGGRPECGCGVCVCGGGQLTGPSERSG